jgi:hypothetical protein
MPGFCWRPARQWIGAKLAGILVNWKYDSFVIFGFIVMAILDQLHASRP